MFCFPNFKLSTNVNLILTVQQIIFNIVFNIYIYKDVVSRAIKLSESLHKLKMCGIQNNFHYYMHFEIC